MQSTFKHIIFCFLISSVLLMIQGDSLSLRKQQKVLTGNEVSVRTKFTEKPPKRIFGTVRYFKQTKVKCCDLGRKMAKIGESCEYATKMANIHRNFAHFHMMKTSVWTKHSHPIEVRRLKKCRRYKGYFEKCCIYESSQIDKDLQRMRKRVRLLKQRFSREKTKQDVKQKVTEKLYIHQNNALPRGP